MANAYLISTNLLTAILAHIRGERPAVQTGGTALVPPYRKRWYRVVALATPPHYTVRLQKWEASGTALVDVTDTSDPEYNVDHDAWDFCGRVGYAALRPGDRVEAWRCWVNGAWAWLIGGTPGGLLNAAGGQPPYEMLPAAGDMGNVAAQIDTWDRSDPPIVPDSDPPLLTQGVIWRGPRVAYDLTSGNYYRFHRDEQMDSQGCRAYLSVETRTILETPIPCVVGG